MPATDVFHGRSAEMVQLEGWLVQDHCRLVSILGMGGQGKTTLAAAVAQAVSSAFEGVIWRSLLNAPPLDEIMRGWLQMLSQQTSTSLPESLDEQLRVLLGYLRQQRCLLILDNVESILQPNSSSLTHAGEVRPGYEGYAPLFQRLASSEHSSCLLLTSRELPYVLSTIARQSPMVRSLSLTGLDLQASQAVLQASGLRASSQDANLLVKSYSGNPLALQIVANTIADFFGGDVAAFQHEEGFVFDGIRAVLDQQFARLSELERDILIWLAIEREAMSVQTLRSNLLQTNPTNATTITTNHLLEALHSLQNRSLLERSSEGLMLQNVIIEYLTEQLVEQMCREIAKADDATRREDKGHPTTRTIALSFLNRFALLKAQSKEYVRQSQLRLIVQPIAQRLVAELGMQSLVNKLQAVLSKLRTEATRQPGYAAGNILNLLLHLNCDTRGFDFSGLSVWQAYLRGKELPEVNFAHADLKDTVFTDVFRAITALAFSLDGKLLAAGTSGGTIGIWQVGDWHPIATWSDPVGIVWSVAFSPDGQTLASGGEDEEIRIWDVATGRVCFVLRGHTRAVKSVAFSPDGTQLVSGGEDTLVRIWDVQSGQVIHALRGHSQVSEQVLFTPEGSTAISASWDRTVRIWDLRTGQTRFNLRGHADDVSVLALSPDGRLLASGSDDHTVRIWDVDSGRALHILEGHPDAIKALAFSQDGQQLASGGSNQTVLVWDVGAGTLLHSQPGVQPQSSMTAMPMRACWAA